jgi:hypothetical protein
MIRDLPCQPRRLGSAVSEQGHDGGEEATVRLELSRGTSGKGKSPAQGEPRQIFEAQFELAHGLLVPLP